MPASTKSSVSALKRVTLRDIAARLGVSHVTISLGMRNHPSIPAARCREIQEVAEQMGYRPDPVLSALVVYRQQTRPIQIQSSIAWINHWDQPENLRKHREFDGYWRGASKAAEKFGYRLDEIRWASDCSAKRFERILLTRNVRGVLIPPHKSPPDWGEFDWKKFSVIRFGMSVPSPDSHLVTADHLRAVVMAMGKIAQYGYQRIGMVVPRDYDRHLGGNYIGGFYAAQKVFRSHHTLPPLMTQESFYRKRSPKAKESLKHWLEVHNPDAILTTVPEVPGLIRELGYRIPDDIAVAGTSTSDVPVDTGINQNAEAIGRIAIEMLVAQINVNARGEPEAPSRILVESLWQDGETLPPR